MATIDNLDLSAYNSYALRILLTEEINSQLRMKEAASIPPQLQLVDISPKLSELDLILGVVPLATPWAYFYPPSKFRNIRRNPFAFSRVAPSFASVEKEEEDLNQVVCHSPLEEEEKTVIRKCLKQMGIIDEMINYIIGRVGQFLQG